MDIENIYRLASQGADLLARGDDFAEALAVRDLIVAHRELAVLSRHGAGASAPVVPGDWQDRVTEAYVCLRRHNSSIPDDTLDTMMLVLRATHTLPEAAAAQEGDSTDEKYWEKQANALNREVCRKNEEIRQLKTDLSDLRAAKQAQPVAHGWTIGDTFEYPNDDGQMVWQSGIHVPGHWQAIVCYGGTKESAEQKRDAIMAAFATHLQPAAEKCACDHTEAECIESGKPMCSSPPAAAAADGAKRMTYDEFFAEAKRLGCKLTPEDCRALLAADGAPKEIDVSQYASDEIKERREINTAYANGWNNALRAKGAVSQAVAPLASYADTIDGPDFRTLLGFVGKTGSHTQEVADLVAHIDARIAEARQQGVEAVANLYDKCENKGIVTGQYLRDFALPNAANEWHATPAAAMELPQAAQDVIAERQRQVDGEGWSVERDDMYIDCELARAAATYTLCTQPSQLSALRESEREK